MRKFHAKVYMEKNMVWGHKSHNFPYILACFLLPANWPAALAGKIPAELSAKIICLCLIYGWRPAYLHATLRAEFSAKFFLAVAFFWEFFTSPLPRFLFLLCHVAKFIYFSHSLLGHRGHQFWGIVMYNFDYTQINKPIWDTHGKKKKKKINSTHYDRCQVMCDGPSMSLLRTLCNAKL